MLLVLLARPDQLDQLVLQVRLVQQVQPELRARQDQLVLLVQEVLRGILVLQVLLVQQDRLELQDQLVLLV